ncbi:AAA family ATPase [Amycolatopsis sp. NPDC059021]|uniref:helix-turn-helix transcriptional regulator n=1 Tax=Amycolatopsis sp. NPDC059021 TaxID=3346704 RepID=UPI00366DE5B3
MLVGRDAVRRDIRDCLDSARRGRPSSLLIEGSHGSGKSVLLDEAAGYARRMGLRTVWVRGTERPHEPVGQAGEAEPALVLLDDLPAASTEALQYLYDVLTTTSIAVVATGEHGHRGSEPDAFEAVVDRFQRRCVLADLDEAGVRALLTLELGGTPRDDVVAEFVRQTAGIPLYVALLARSALRIANPERLTVRDVRRAGVTGIADALAGQSWRAGYDVMRVIDAVAILEPNASVRFVATFLDLDELRIADVLDALRKRGTVTEIDSRYALSVPVVRRAVLDRLSPSEYELANLRAASLLREEFGANSEITRYLLRNKHMTHPRWACSVIRETAADAAALGRTEQAVEFLLGAAQRCGHECKVGLLREVGRLLTYRDTKKAIHYFSRALRYAEELSVRVPILIQIANAYVIADDAETAVDVLRKGIDEASGAERRLVRRMDEERYLIGAVHWSSRGEEPAPETSEAAVAHPADHRTADRVELVNLAFRENRRQAWRRETMVACAQRALTKDPGTGIDALLAPVLLLLYAGEFAAAADECDRMLQRQPAETRPYTQSVRAAVSLQLGDLAEARRAAAEALRAKGFVRPNSLYAGLAITGLVGACLETGELEAGQNCLDDAGFSGDIPVGSPPALLVQRAYLHTERGAFDAAFADLEQCARRWHTHGAYDPIEARWRSAYAMVCVRAGRGGPAAGFALAELERARQAGIAVHIGTALRVVAMCAGGVDREKLLTEAVATLERTPARLDLAYALFDLGVLLRKLNQFAAARRRLRSALAHAERTGATVLAEWTRSELTLARARPRRSAETGVGALTPSERRVAALAAQGLTNKRIAGILYVTCRTVEIHLSRAYKKLLISSRAELGAALGEPDRSHGAGTVAGRPADDPGVPGIS